MQKKRLKSKYKISGLTRAQQEWLQNYEGHTMLEPLGLEELKVNPALFNEHARWNIQHFQDFSIDALHAIDRDVPYNEGAAA